MHVTQFSKSRIPTQDDITLEYINSDMRVYIYLQYKHVHASKIPKMSYNNI